MGYKVATWGSAGARRRAARRAAVAAADASRPAVTVEERPSSTEDGRARRSRSCDHRRRTFLTNALRRLDGE